MREGTLTDALRERLDSRASRRFRALRLRLEPEAEDAVDRHKSRGDQAHISRRGCHIAGRVFSLAREAAARASERLWSRQSSKLRKLQRTVRGTRWRARELRHTRRPQAIQKASRQSRPGFESLLERRR